MTEFIVKGVCENCDECTDSDHCYGCGEFKCQCFCWHEKEKERFLKRAMVKSPDWDNILCDVPRQNENGTFGLRFEFIGNKHFIDKFEADKLAAWMRLTEQLFL